MGQWALKEASTRKGRQRRGRDFIRRQLQPSCRHGDECGMFLWIGTNSPDRGIQPRGARIVRAYSLGARSYKKACAQSGRIASANPATTKLKSSHDGLNPASTRKP